MRRLDEWDARIIPGTDGALNPFFSPDGKWVAFRRADSLEKVPTRGGSPQRVCRAVGGTHGTWGNDGFIILTTWPEVGLWRVSADGETPQILAR